MHSVPPPNTLSHRELSGTVPCRPLGKCLLVTVGTFASLVLRDPAEDSQSVEDIKRERERDGDLTSTQITVGIKGGTVSARVAEEIGPFQNSASFLKPSLDKPFMWQ